MLTSNGQTRFYSGKLLRPAPNGGYGHLTVSLWRDGGASTKKVHRLVMDAFAGQCPEGMEVCHGAGGKADNRLANLSYGTRSQNAGIDRLRDETDNRGIKHGMAKLTETDVRAIRASNEIGRVLAARYGIAQQHVSLIKRRGAWRWLSNRPVNSDQEADVCSQQKQMLSQDRHEGRESEIHRQ